MTRQTKTTEPKMETTTINSHNNNQEESGTDDEQRKKILLCVANVFLTFANDKEFRNALSLGGTDASYSPLIGGAAGDGLTPLEPSLVC